MRFCLEHWAALREAIEERGLSALVAENGERAAQNTAAELDGQGSIDTFDPLMHAHMAIVAHAMETVKSRYQQNPLMLMAPEEDPEVTWPLCPLCFLNWLHEEHNRICEKPDCDYPKEYDYAGDWIPQAADGALAQWRELQP